MTQQAVLFGWTGLVVAFTLFGLGSAVFRPSWWGRDRAVGWYEVLVVSTVGLIPLLSVAIAN